MSAVVVAFEAYKPNPQRPWRNDELAELYRAVDILGRAGLAIETDMGMSDEGDPWFAFCRADNGEVIVHCARINGFFVANSIAIDQTFRGTNFREVIESIVRYEPLKLPLSSAGSRLSLHPVMIMAAFVATALLFAKKADAHDLHAAVVALNGHHDAGGNQKGLAAVKTAVGGFLQSIVDAPGDSKPGSNASGQLGESEAPAALATLMAAAMTLVSSVAQMSGVEDILPSGAAVVTPADAHVPVLVQSEIVPALSLATDHVATAAKAVDDSSSYQAWVGALLAGSQPLLGPKAVISVQIAVAHEVSAVDLSTAPPAEDTTHGPAVALAALPAEHLAPLPQLVATTEASATSSADAATAAASTQSSTTSPASEFSELSSVATAILFGPLGAQPQGDALQILENSKPVPKALVTPAAVATPDNQGDVANQAAGNNAAHQPQQPAAGVDAAAGGAAPAATNDPAAPAAATPAAPAANPPAAATPAGPEFIWLTTDPETGIAQLVNYAESNHPVTSASLSPAPDLTQAVTFYNAETSGHVRLLVFDSTAIHLPFFELTNGVMMVSDQELGITPTPAALAAAAIVELANGAQVKILGVIDTAQTHMWG